MFHYENFKDKPNKWSFWRAKGMISKRDIDSFD
jgi:hypothetical protein